MKLLYIKQFIKYKEYNNISNSSLNIKKIINLNCMEQLCIFLDLNALKVC